MGMCITVKNRLIKSGVGVMYIDIKYIFKLTCDMLAELF